LSAGRRPDEIRFTEALPKTRSGKIVRRLLRDVASGRQTTGDTTTLEDYSVLARLPARGRGVMWRFLDDGGCSREPHG
jgi:acetyl-CoA synthetase